MLNDESYIRVKKVIENHKVKKEHANASINLNDLTQEEKYILLNEFWNWIEGI